MVRPAGMMMVAMLLALPASAQSPAGGLGSGNRFHVSIRWDPAPLVAVGFGHGFEAAPLDRRAAIDVEIRKPIFLGGWRDFQLRSGPRIELTTATGGFVVNRLQLVIHSQENVRITGLGFGLEERLIGGWIADRGYAAADAGYTWFALNRMRHRSSGERGWYTGAGGKWAVGGSGGVFSDAGSGVTLDAALVKTGRWRNFNPAGPPIRAGLGFEILDP